MWFNSDRTPLDAKFQPTIRFKSQFPSFDDFKNAIVNFGDGQVIAEVKFYNYLFWVNGDAFLTSNIKEKNDYILGWNYSIFYTMFERERQIYNKSIEEILQGNIDIENKLFTVNKSDEDDYIIDNYLDNSTSSSNITKEAMVKYLPFIKQQFINTPVPEEQFLKRLQSTIFLTVQGFNFKRWNHIILGVKDV